MSRDNQGPTGYSQPGENQGQHAARILPYDPQDGQSYAPRAYAGPDVPPTAATKGTTDPANAPYNPQVSPQPAAPRTGPSACLVMAVTFGVLAFSCMLLTFATLQGGLSGLGKLGGLVPSLGLSFATTPTVTIDTSRPSVIEQVRSLSKLETVHYDLEKVITGKSSGPLFDFLTSDKILLVAHGEVVGGVDLGSVTTDAVKVDGDRVTIRLPRAEILYSKLDNDKTYVYDRQTGLLSKPDPNLESRLRVAGEEQIVEAAKEDGILSKAEENVKQTLRTMLHGLGYGDVQFEEEP